MLVHISDSLLTFPVTFHYNAVKKVKVNKIGAARRQNKMQTKIQAEQQLEKNENEEVVIQYI